MKKILIIEDDAFLKTIESSKFTKEGFAVASAMTLEEIDAVMTEGKPDIILLDLMLPNIDGFEILEKLKREDATKAIPVIVFSNLSSEIDRKKVTDAGAAELMIKSNFTLDEVVEKIKTLTA
jgi:DNA-binding response OmpR family regulator